MAVRVLAVGRRRAVDIHAGLSITRNALTVAVRVVNHRTVGTLELPVDRERAEQLLRLLQRVLDRVVLARQVVPTARPVVDESAEVLAAELRVVLGEEDEVVPQLVDRLGRREGLALGRGAAEVEELLHVLERLLRYAFFPPVLVDHTVDKRLELKAYHGFERNVIPEVGRHGTRTLCRQGRGRCCDQC